MFKNPVSANRKPHGNPFAHTQFQRAAPGMGFPRLAQESSVRANLHDTDSERRESLTTWGNGCAVMTAEKADFKTHNSAITAQQSLDFQIGTDIHH